MVLSLIGPNYWVFFKDSAFSNSQDYYTLCPGEYQASTDFDDNSINSLARGSECTYSVYFFLYLIKVKQLVFWGMIHWSRCYDQSMIRSGSLLMNVKICSDMQILTLL